MFFDEAGSMGGGFVKILGIESKTSTAMMRFIELTPNKRSKQ